MTERECRILSECIRVAGESTGNLELQIKLIKSGLWEEALSTRNMQTPHRKALADVRIRNHLGVRRHRIL